MYQGFLSTKDFDSGEETVCSVLADQSGQGHGEGREQNKNNSKSMQPGAKYYYRKMQLNSPHRP